jgi:hypothetical protein
VRRSWASVPPPRRPSPPPDRRRARASRRARSWSEDDYASAELTRATTYVSTPVVDTSRLTARPPPAPALAASSSASGPLPALEGARTTRPSWRGAAPPAATRAVRAPEWPAAATSPPPSACGAAQAPCCAPPASLRPRAEPLSRPAAAPQAGGARRHCTLGAAAALRRAAAPRRAAAEAVSRRGRAARVCASGRADGQSWAHDAAEHLAGAPPGRDGLGDPACLGVWRTRAAFVAARCG